MSRDSFDLMRLLRAPSNPALNVSRDGASTTSLGNLCQCSTTLITKNFLLIFNLNSLLLNHYPLSCHNRSFCFAPGQADAGCNEAFLQAGLMRTAGVLSSPATWDPHCFLGPIPASQFCQKNPLWPHPVTELQAQAFRNFASTQSSADGKVTAAGMFSTMLSWWEGHGSSHAGRESQALPIMRSRLWEGG